MSNNIWEAAGAYYAEPGVDLPLEAVGAITIPGLPEYGIPDLAIPDGAVPQQPPVVVPTVPGQSTPVPAGVGVQFSADDEWDKLAAMDAAYKAGNNALGNGLSRQVANRLRAVLSQLGYGPDLQIDTMWGSAADCGAYRSMLQKSGTPPGYGVCGVSKQGFIALEQQNDAWFATGQTPGPYTPVYYHDLGGGSFVRMDPQPVLGGGGGGTGITEQECLAQRGMWDGEASICRPRGVEDPKTACLKGGGFWNQAKMACEKKSATILGMSPLVFGLGAAALVGIGIYYASKRDPGKPKSSVKARDTWVTPYTRNARRRRSNRLPIIRDRSGAYYVEGRGHSWGSFPTYRAAAAYFRKWEADNEAYDRRMGAVSREIAKKLAREEAEYRRAQRERLAQDAEKYR